MNSPTPSPETAKRPTISSGSILVTGDVIRDIYVYQGDRKFPAQPGNIAPFFADRPGGARSLYEIIAAGAPASVKWGLQKTFPKSAIQPVHTLWSPCEGGTMKEQEDAPKSKKPPKVWRVSQSLGYALGVGNPGALTKSVEAANRYAVLVIDDAGLGFRTMPAKGSWPTGVSPTEQQPSWIILKMADPVAMGDLWREIIGGDKPARRKNLVVIVSADELRRAGAAISCGFSWESTLTELCAELNDNPVFKPFLQFPGHLIVNFGCEGAVWFGEPDPDHAANLAQNLATLVYDPTLPEDGWKTRLPDEHQVYGHTNTFTAAIALAAADASLADPKVLNAAISHGLSACRLLRLKGHGDVSIPKPGPPLVELAKLLSPSRPVPDSEIPILKNLIPQGFQTIHGPAFRTKPGDAAVWTLAALAENPPDQPQLPLFGLAHRVALYGLPDLRRIPHAHFGAMVSVDRSEIETLRSLTLLIKRYQDEKLPKQPLSIAAFGPPGAGKSFGIKEIAKQVLGSDVPILEFNLSQFDAASDLFGAFHQVRDKALKNLVPVVFWDEFDSRDYKWLQYLLAPMQDGAFEENGHTHAIGKCLFVFAGGTSWDFEHFGPAPMPVGWSSACLKPKQRDGPESSDLSKSAVQLVEFYGGDRERINADAAANEEFRRKKGPDFLSRLDGHIDVLGPNQRTLYNWSTRTWDQADPHDITFPVRRALLLRQFLGAKKPGETLNIDRDLLHAFLHVPRYRHGARSLEKIARHLGLARPPFRRADMPPPQVLSQHLDTFAEFDRIYHQTHHFLTPPAIEAMANAINEGYNSDNPSPWNKSFDKLDAFLQQSNRAAALRIPYILALAGLRLTVRPAGQSKVNLNDPKTIETALRRDPTPEESAVSNQIEKHVEVLAEEEHRLWVQFHEENGWRFGWKVGTQPDPKDPAKTIKTLEKDKANLLHPCISPFHEMPDNYGQREKWQDFDRNAVRRYPRLLRLTEFEITFARSETPFAGAKSPPTLASPHPPPP